MDILFFDDNQVLNYIVSQKLEKEGYRVYSALSRDEALSWLGKGNKPAIALLDIVDEERVFRGEISPRDPEAGFKIADKIKEIDPEAFISMGSVMGVYGQGFEKLKL